MLFDYSNVAALLPHSGVMVLLDKVLAFDGKSLTAELTVRADGLLGNGLRVPAWAGIEYMAQAVGAYAGVKSLLAGEPVRLGYLLGTRRYHCNVPDFTPGLILTVKVTNVIQDDKLGVFDCRIDGDGVEISANLNVYQPHTDTFTSPQI